MHAADTIRRMTDAMAELETYPAIIHSAARLKGVTFDRDAKGWIITNEQFAIIAPVVRAWHRRPRMSRAARQPASS